MELSSFRPTQNVPTHHSGGRALCENLRPSFIDTARLIEAFLVFQGGLSGVY